MKLNYYIELFLIIVILVFLPPSDAGKKKLSFKPLSLSTPHLNPAPQTPATNLQSPTHPNPGPSGSTSRAKSVPPKDPFPHLPGTGVPKPNVVGHRHDNFPALGSNRPKTYHHHEPSLPTPQRKLSLPPQIESPLSTDRFARLSGGHLSSRNVNQPKQVERTLASGSSGHLNTINQNPSSGVVTRRKVSREEYPSLPSSSSSLQSLGHPRKDSLSKPMQQISLEEYPALGPPKGSLASSLYPVERSSSLTLQQNQLLANRQPFVRRGSVDSTKISQINSPLNNPLNKNKNFFGSSSSSLTGTSGIGRSPSISSGSISSGLNSPSIGGSRRSSNLAQVPYTPVDVSDETCKDDSSSANQCFNYFTFSLFWPPALGYEYKSNHKPVNDNINQVKWSIHGLWPSSYTGVIPENCRKRTSVSFSQHRLDREKGLRASLESMWFNICPYKMHGCSMVSFWDREFSKHGACASRSPLIGSDVGYFKMAVNLANIINMDTIISNIGLRPGKIMTYGDIVDNINGKIGNKVRVNIIENKKTKEYYLKQIQVCFDLSFHRIDCPGVKLLLEETRNKEIRHLNYVPSL